MPQLTALDAQFLQFETATNIANIAGLGIVEGELDRAGLLALLEARLPYVPALRRRLARVPLGLDHPYWAQEDDLDLDYHVRELGLPSPGDDAQLAEQVSRLHSRRLDRGRPLWEIYLIHGLAGGHTGLYTKIHHAAVDGIGGADVLAALLDTGPVPKPPPAEPPEHDPPPPGLAEMLARGLARLAGNPAQAVRFAARAVPHLDEIPVVSRIPGSGTVSGLARRLAGAGRAPGLPSLPAPRTPFSGPVSEHRRFAFVSLPLGEIKQVRKAHEVTVNDVVMAVCAGALRLWLAAHGGVPRRPLVAGVPFSLRATGIEGPGNQVSFMTAPLGVHLDDPLARLRQVSHAMRRIKERFALAPAPWLSELSESMPAALMGLASRSAFGLLGQTAPPVNVAVSNVPGPQLPLYVCGARLLAHYPVSVITDVSGGVNITAFSYDGSLDIGVVTDRAMVPDAWELTGYLRDALDELLNAEP
ncbi:WS/DGAT/MGAT family O-acyltransferase [Nonomuraea cavernae]|uniref:Diacylglycerol O-acyltransferase n=1 Tax=Nonomuraea cavernae TaxID=2045107 RepID=A0A918DGM7_9ACTN|nr:wax ester/triacylglycerol synthase family O-acyltransferase [Nonomuraea cavernae]MCA2184531.1 wax ester/triacylglycerol synthase family O-acyltransferase [Nonomuraea cavernae]GGO63507.1 diacylglycerol O-acyltransferase [Nonomuraea cavernae]